MAVHGIPPEGSLSLNGSADGTAGFVEANGHRIELAAFHHALLHWGRTNFREYPWRVTHDPYRILVAEVMLHRTQAPQVVPVYNRFVERYPDVQALADAGRDELHQALFSLGLRWRIDLLYDMARRLEQDFGGGVPVERGALLSLPGVSDYVAGATRCFAWNLPEALIDTNTVRVAGRLFGLEVRDSSRRNRLFRSLLEALVDREEPRAYNYALLDLADRICMKRRPPQHGECPLLPFCVTGGKTTGAEN